MDIRKNKNWLRTAAYAPLAVAVLAGAICSGAGIGSADTDAIGSPRACGPSEGTDTEACEPPPFTTLWRVHNNTDEVLTGGGFTKKDGAHRGGTIDVTGLPPGESREGRYDSVFLEENVTWSEGICYKHQTWRLHMQKTPRQRWENVHVLVDKRSGDLFVTREGGGDNYMMFTMGGRC
ncbi:hypothetical protein [Rhodococcus jostii]|uniref:hypothetical protein n=1 Tax=Rhodococcus jostii TaxID=132919 RepID=UPI00362A387E